MKTIFKFILISSFIVLCSAFTFSQDKRTVTTTFWVAGVCGLCEETIEKAMDAKGIVAADYVLETNMLTVTYKPKKITEDQIHHLLNETGYDTAVSKCTEEQYQRTHHCCRYRDMEKH